MSGTGESVAPRYTLSTSSWGIWEDVRAERIRAHRKHGDTSMESSSPLDPTGRRFRILTEELGEVAQEFNDAEHDRRAVDLALLHKELIQVAAMAGAWADACALHIAGSETQP